MAFLGA